MIKKIKNFIKPKISITNQEIVKDLLERGIKSENMELAACYMEMAYVVARTKKLYFEMKPRERIWYLNDKVHLIGIYTPLIKEINKSINRIIKKKQESFVKRISR